MKQPLEERFWAKVAIIPEHPCWEWTAVKWGNGYGSITIKGRMQSAHRVSYEMAYGSFDKSLHVLHRCDNPGCVRPDHLFLGTHQDNTKDKVSKNRQSALKGVVNPKSKLTEEQVLEIRSLRGFYDLKTLAKVFNVSFCTISDICRGKTWQHI